MSEFEEVMSDGFIQMYPNCPLPYPEKIVKMLKPYLKKLVKDALQQIENKEQDDEPT